MLALVFHCVSHLLGLFKIHTTRIYIIQVQTEFNFSKFSWPEKVLDFEFLYFLQFAVV